MLILFLKLFDFLENDITTYNYWLLRKTGQKTIDNARHWVERAITTNQAVIFINTLFL